VFEATLSGERHNRWMVVKQVAEALPTPT